MHKTMVAGLLALALAGCDGAAPDTTQVPAAAAAPAPDAFYQCRSCHSVMPGRNGAGPSLWGVVGRRAGTKPEFAGRYTGALVGSGLVWDAATLDRWLAGPTKLVPGTRMAIVPVDDPARRKQIVDYLATLR